MTVTLLDQATAPGAGAAFNIAKGNGPRHTVQAIMGGTVVATAVTIDLEGSLDGKTWFQLAQHIFSAGDITAESAMFHVVDKLVNFVRANLITLTGGTAPDLTVTHQGGRRATT